MTKKCKISIANFFKIINFNALKKTEFIVPDDIKGSERWLSIATAVETLTVFQFGMMKIGRA